jgi:gamma-glutamyl AIG2-like cyclotransferase
VRHPRLHSLIVSDHPAHGVTFAYGSNTDHAQMLARCPRARALGLVRIAGYRLEFFGAADLEPDPAAAVVALAWQIDEHDERALDEREGVFRRPVPSYEKIPLIAQLGERLELHGFVYAMTAPRRARDPRPPPPHYFARILTGYAQHGIEPSGLFAARARALHAAQR